MPAAGLVSRSSPDNVVFLEVGKKRNWKKKVQHEFYLLLTEETSNVMLGAPNEGDMQDFLEVMHFRSQPNLP